MYLYNIIHVLNLFDEAKVGGGWWGMGVGGKSLTTTSIFTPCHIHSYSMPGQNACEHNKRAGSQFKHKQKTN